MGCRARREPDKRDRHHKSWHHASVRRAACHDASLICAIRRQVVIASHHPGVPSVFVSMGAVDALTTAREPPPANFGV
jgi:hypothetical protein